MPNSDIFIRNVKLSLASFGGNEAPLTLLLGVGEVALNKAVWSIEEYRMGLAAIATWKPPGLDLMMHGTGSFRVIMLLI